MLVVQLDGQERALRLALKLEMKQRRVEIGGWSDTNVNSQLVKSAIRSGGQCQVTAG